MSSSSRNGSHRTSVMFDLLLFRVDCFRTSHWRRAPIRLAAVIDNSVCHGVKGGTGGSGVALPKEELALLNGHVGPIVLTRINLIWTKQFVLSKLFKPMGQPPGHPCHCEQRCKQVGLDSHLVVNDPGVEIDVGINPLPLQQLLRDSLDL